MKPAAVGILFVTILVAGCVATFNDRILVGKSLVVPWQDKKVIAHRGASAYLPEHTLEAKAMAFAQGAHFIEQDLVMTKDDELVVLHDLQLDAVTNVRDAFPGRSRDDGRYYVVDFTLEELRTLDITERFRFADGEKIAAFEERFPLGKSTFRINTFAEEIELIQGLNQSTGRSVGIYPEIKDPAFHRGEGKDISVAVLKVLQAYGYDERQDSIFLQCFDAYELQRIRGELFPTMNISVPLVQLLGTQPIFKALLSPQGLKTVSAYADGIGPAMQLLVAPGSSSGKLQITNLARLAHDLGLVVHPFTFRRDRLPAYADDYDDLLKIFLDDIGVDGVFTDFPDLTVAYIQSRL